MAKEQKLVEAITPIQEDFAQWYTDIVKKAELVDYSSVKGFVILRPYGYAIWENVQRLLDDMFKQTGHQNVSMPLLIPESLLQKEKDHVEGFAPEVAWVTMGGSEPLSERLCIRPTSETLFCEHFEHVIQSYRDLPKLYNQWCSVVRWEKTTRPFLRSREFLWQEGHTMHETAEQAEAETLQMLGIYERLCRDYLMIPVVPGKKTDKEKFAGAVSTYTIEAMMHDGKSLQSGTSHYFGDGFARAFDITFTARDNSQQFPHQTSWGLSTRIIGAIIMCHGDDNGLILPPAVAPTQAVIVPVAMHKPGVLEAAGQLRDGLRAAGFRVHLDDSDQSPGWKFAEYEMKGVPLRVEIGPRDIEQGQCVLVRRDSGQKRTAPLDGLAEEVAEQLSEMERNLYNRALDNRSNRTITCPDYSHLEQAVAEQTGFYLAGWCGGRGCEDDLRERLEISSRCIPFDAQAVSDQCVVCGKPSKHTVMWGKAY